MKVRVKAIVKDLVGVIIILMAVGCCSASVADVDFDKTIHSINIPATNAASALNELAFQTGAVLLFPYQEAKAQQANAVVGDYTLKQAMAMLLKDSGLVSSLTKDGAIKISVFGKSASKKSEERMTMNTKKQLLASVIASVMGAGVQGALAQEEVAGSEEWLLEEVVVTAQKREQNLVDVPISILAMGAAEIEARGIGNFEELGLAVPGLTVQDNGATRRVYMRGLGNTAGASSSLIGLYIDDMSVSGNPAFTLDVRPYDMERMEVLRGPQGTLYGDGSVGGTLRFITKKPQLDIFSANADIAATVTKGGDPSQKIQAALNVPLISDELGLRIVGTFEDTGGWIDQPKQSIKDYNGQEVVNIRVNGLWRATDVLDVSAMFIAHRNDGSSNSGEDENGDYTQSFDFTAPPSLQDDYEVVNLTLTYDFGAFEVLSSTGYLDSARELNGSGSVFLGSDILLDNYPVSSRILSEELRITSTNEDALHWSIGAFYKDRKTDQSGDSYFGAPGTPLPSAFSFASSDKSASWAVFADTSYSLTERLEIGGGLRYFEDEREFSSGSTLQKGSFDSTSPRVYVNYDLTDDIKTYASVAKGFRSGGFNQLEQPTFGPEEVWSYELGTKMILLNAQLGFEFAVFYSEYTDFQISGILPPPAPPITITSNGGSAEVKGVDLSLTWQATDGLQLRFNGSYVDTEVVKLGVTESTHIVGDRLDYVPEYSAALSAIQSVEWGGKPGSVRLDYNVQGSMLLTDRSLGLFGSSGVINMLNFNVDWEWSEDISLGVFGKNLLDENDFIDPLTVFELASRPRPRTFGVQVGLTF